MVATNVSWKQENLAELDAEGYQETWNTWAETPQYTAWLNVHLMDDLSVRWLGVTYVRRERHMEAVIDRGDAETVDAGKRLALEAAHRIGTDPATHEEAMPVPLDFLQPLDDSDIED